MLLRSASERYRADITYGMPRQTRVKHRALRNMPPTPRDPVSIIPLLSPWTVKKV